MNSILIELRILFFHLVGRLSFLLFFFLERYVGMRTFIRLTHLIRTLPSFAMESISNYFLYTKSTCICINETISEVANSPQQAILNASASNSLTGSFNLDIFWPESYPYFQAIRVSLLNKHCGFSQLVLSIRNYSGIISGRWRNEILYEIGACANTYYSGSVLERVGALDSSWNL